MSRQSPAPRYGVLVPVKQPSVAKSRLAALGEPARTALVAAFAVDTVSAALDCRLVDVVMAVTDDHLLAADLAQLGAEVLPDGVADDLNGTLRLAAAELLRRHPDLRPAALCADLPALVAEELAEALAVVPDDAFAFVADADGIGTTLTAAARLDLFAPAYGAGSRVQHLALGGHEIDGDEGSALATLRRDVDTPADLAAAVALGLGPRTSLVVTADAELRSRYHGVTLRGGERP